VPSSDASRSPARRIAGWTLASFLVALALVAAAGLTAVWLYRGAPDLARAPGWFYFWVNKGSLDMLVVAATTAALPWLVRASFRWAGPRPWVAAWCVVAGSIALQIATGLIARTQIHGWTERFFVGHGEFTMRAKEVPDALALLRNYESLAAANQLGLYGPSKPPGTYAVYLAIDRTSRSELVRSLLTPLTQIVALDPGVQPADRALVAWTIFVLGLCAALTILPLCQLGRMLFAGQAESPRVYTYPAWLFAAAPVTNVITVHLDSTVFPLLSAASVAACAFSTQLVAGPEGLAAEGGGHPRVSAVAASVGGMFGMLAVYCSYGNLPILALGGVTIVAMLLQHRAEAGSASRPLIAFAVPLAGFVGGALATLLFLRIALDWQPIAGYLRGVEYHRRWRPNLPSAWRHGLAFLEFSLFAGPPLILAFLASSAHASVAVVRAAGSWFRKRALPPLPYGAYGISIGTALVIATITLALGTPEAARLWLFMLPWVCCAASALFLRLSWDGAFVALLAASIVLTFFVKNYLVW
jgi:hypothetical protein